MIIIIITIISIMIIIVIIVIIVIVIIIIIMRTAAAARPRAHDGVHRGRAREPRQILINGQHAPAGMSAAEAADMRQVEVPDEAWADHVHGPFRVGMPVFWSHVSVQLEKAFKELW